MTQTDGFKMLKLLKKGAKAPVNYTFVPVYMYMCIKFDLRRKYLLDSGGNIIGSSDKGPYFVVSSIKNILEVFFLLHLNNM